MGPDPGPHAHRSIVTQPTPPPASISDRASVQAGAKAYSAQGCANCHGAPGVNWAKFSEGLHPDPPDLKEVVDHRTPAQLFWVIKNGINMTGMPSFALAGAKDDEIWSDRCVLEETAERRMPTTRPGPRLPPAPPAPPPAAAPPPRPIPPAPPAPPAESK